jgi:putative addiction module component (TIGR02574 family)
MTLKTKQFVEKALSLPPAERLSIVDSLLLSLDRPDPKIDALWKIEAERRIKDYKAGKIKSIPLHHALSKYRIEQWNEFQRKRKR